MTEETDKFREKKIIEMKFGSHLYGTNTPASDLDFKAVHIPHYRDILLGEVKDVITRNTKEGSLTKNTVEDVDYESYTLQKFLKLAAEGQTVAMDILFCTPDMFTIKPHFYWHYITENRGKLLTSKAASFIGYCRTQANKYGIKGSRMNTAEAVVNLLKEELDKRGTVAKLEDIRAQLGWFTCQHHHAVMYEIEQPGINDTVNKIWHIDICNRKCPLTFTIKEAYKIYSNLFNEYGKRARAAKNNEGIDWKALSHAVRVGSECVELLTTNNITFPRPEAKLLLQIKKGEMPYPEIAERIEQLLVDAEAASAKSTLPAEPDYEWIENFVFSVHEERVMYPYA